MNDDEFAQDCTKKAIGVMLKDFNASDLNKVFLLVSSIYYDAYSPVADHKITEIEISIKRK